MTLEQWITKYEEKAEKIIILPGFLLYFEPNKGFFYWKVTGDVFEIDHCCTNDIKHIHNIACEMAKKRLCKVVATSTYRDPAAYMRLTKTKIHLPLSGIRQNGKFYWVFYKEVH